MLNSHSQLRSDGDPQLPVNSLLKSDKESQLPVNSLLNFSENSLRFDGEFTLSVNSLLDWLYTGPETKSGALILFPRMIDRWNVAATIVSKWDRFRITVVTDYPDDFIHTINSSSSSSLTTSTPAQSGGSQAGYSPATNWKHLDTSPFQLLKYSQLEEISRALHNSEVDLVLFDDARMLATIAPGLALNIIRPRILVLTSWGDTQPQLDSVTSRFPGLELLALNLISDSADIEWERINIPMSERQFYYYSVVRYQEIDRESNNNLNSPSIPKIPYPKSRMLTLYTYPESIMEDTLQHQSICETDQTSTPDTLIGQTWLNSEYLQRIEEDGPKLASILDGTISQWPAKQIILTRFNHRYGVDLIQSFFQLLTEAGHNPYELDEIYTTSCTHAYDDNITALHRFNQATTGILITNLTPLIPLYQISVIHIADSYAFPTIIGTIDRCHKRYLQPGQHLKICSHVATLGTHEFVEAQSADQALADHLDQQRTQADRLFEGLLTQSLAIVYDPSNELIVK